MLIGGLVAGAALLGGGGIWFARQVLPGWARPISPTFEIQLDTDHIGPALVFISFGAFNVVNSLIPLLVREVRETE